MVSHPPDEAPSLEPMLDRLRAQRATGCLRVSSGSRQANLYFLFGHLYHAEGPAGTGDAVLAEASRWSPVSAKLDPKAKLPEIESITTMVVESPGQVDKPALLNQYATAPAVDTNDPARQVIPLSTSERVLRAGLGGTMVAGTLVGVLTVPTVPVGFLAACLGLFGIILVWWALSWKLVLTSSGFEVVGMVSRKRRRWVDVSGFEVDISTAGRGLHHVVRFKDSPSFVLGKMQAAGKWRYALGALGNSFAPRGMNADAQVKLLEDWRRRYS